MIYDSLREAVIGLPDDKILQLIEYAKFLKQNIGKKVESGAKKKIIREIGCMKEGFISISSDFDDCIEGWETKYKIFDKRD